MATVTILTLSDETHRALRRRAEQNGRSTEAEIRSILDSAVQPPEPDVLAAFEASRRKHGPVGLEVERDRTPAGSTGLCE